MEFIREVMTHPRVWPHISDDNSPWPDAFEPIVHPGLYYLAPECDGERVGVFLYHSHSAVLWEVHTCILPKFWGEPATQAARDGLRWMLDNTKCRKVITHVPKPNVPARRFAMRVGMWSEGINRKSFLKDGVLHDQFILGITEDEIQCLPQP